MKPFERLKQLVERLTTQDNRATAHPLYCVEQEHRIYGMREDCADKYIWQRKESLDCTFRTKEEVVAFCDELTIDEDDFEKVFYALEWRFVNAHFTEDAAQQYIDNNDHNLTNPRIFVTSQHSCYEWIEIVEILKNLTTIDSDHIMGIFSTGEEKP
jgi:hypothetical protein